MSIAIDKGIPIPAKYAPRGELLATLEALEVGDSFLQPKAKRNQLGGYFARFRDRKFTSRSVDEKTVRVWRIA